MLLAQVIDDLPVTGVQGALDVDVLDVEHDSRRVTPGSLFCCVRGGAADGHRFAPDAVRAGARGLLVDHELDDPALAGITQVVVPDVRLAMAGAAATCWGHPSRALTVVGVTGTNGKTTTTFLLHGIFEEAGLANAVLGTLSGPRTTPEAPELQRWLAQRRAEGTVAVAMEVSSHALDLHRVDGTHFAAAAFTNLSRDHLDHHASMEAYFEAKARLFTPAFTDRAAVNADDPWGRRLLDAADGVAMTPYRLADAEGLEVGSTGSRFRWRGHDVSLGMGGRFNVANALAAAGAAALVGIDDGVIAAGLSRPVVVPGRFEAIDEGQPFRVVVDYAHTPDGLEQVLRAAREVAGAGRVHVLFGCGGDRDATKRPAMGAAAAQGADAVVVTADNSRHEDTRAIISAVIDGYEHAPDRRATSLVVEADRDAAIATTLAAASPGDVVVLAGKGHETTQTIGDTVTDFDDREVARRHLRALLGGGADS